MKVGQAIEPLRAQTLNEKFAKQRDSLTPSNQLRLRRSISWLVKAQGEHAQQDYDAAFIFHWIAFNSMYAQRDSETMAASDPIMYKQFLQHTASLDQWSKIKETLRPLYGTTITVFVQTRFVFPAYWKSDWNPALGIQTDNSWEQVRKNVTTTISNAISPRGDEVRALNCLFDLLYTLRNQLMHGLSTYCGSLNRDQVQHGAILVAHLVPTFVDLMLSHPDEDFGESPYPPT